jgi:copper chaperone CopZ
MKTQKIISTLILTITGLAMAFGQAKTKEFKVYGNCGMCEQRIEKAAKSVEGVTSAQWDQKSEYIKVAYNDSKTNLDAIHKAIAAVGHDTKKAKASDKTYNELPACCKYSRKKGKDSQCNHHDH